MDPIEWLGGHPLVGLLLVLAGAGWLYVVYCVHSMRAGIQRLATEIRATREGIGEKTTLEQRGEILRRTGWMVSYLEEIDRKLAQAQREMKVASITAENLVVKPSLSGGAAEPKRAANEGTMRLSR